MVNARLNKPRTKNGPKIQWSLHKPPTFVMIKMPSPPHKLYKPLMLPIVSVESEDFFKLLMKLILVIITPVCDKPMKATTMKEPAVLGS